MKGAEEGFHATPRCPPIPIASDHFFFHHVAAFGLVLRPKKIAKRGVQLARAFDQPYAPFR